jgi:two-component system response regulator FlrC
VTPRLLSKLVLVVEDDVALRREFCSAIDQAGFPAIGASDGADAVSYLSSGAPVPALIVLDLGMSRMNGWEFRSWLSHDPELGRVPVVIASGLPRLESLKKELGAVACLAKPFSPDALIDAVRRYSA